MQLKCRLLISFWTPLLCVAAGNTKSSGLRGSGYPVDSPDATWLPVEDEVDESLADTKDEIETAEKELSYVKQYCNGKNHGRCKRQVERMSARLERLIAAEKKLREKDTSAKKVEESVRNSSETVYQLEDQVNSLHAVKKFAELSKKDFDNQESRLNEASQEYTNKMEQAQSQIDALKLDLKRARRLHYDAEQKSLNLIAKAKGIERGVETTDLFADTEFARAVRKQRVAEGLYARADAIREHAEKMIILHHDENKSEVKEVMYGTAHRLITEDQSIVNFGHMSDFGGELPHEDMKGKPCKKLKPKKEPKQEPEPEPAESASDEPAESAQPAANVGPVKDNNNVNAANDEGWKEVDMNKANDHKDQWVALHHHKSSRKKIKVAPKRSEGNTKRKMMTQPKKAPEAKPAAVVVEKPAEPKKEPEAAQKGDYDEEDEAEPVEDDESSDDASGEVAIPAVEVTTTTTIPTPVNMVVEDDVPAVEVQSTTTTTTVAPVDAPVQADSVNTLASEEARTDLDEDDEAPEVDEDAANMDEAEQQFNDAEEAEKNLN